MALCSLLPPDGKLREVLDKALAVQEEPLLARTTRPTGLHPFETKSWLESLWARDGLSDEERELVAWQNDSDNMGAALRELQEVEEQIGLVLVAQQLRREEHHFTGNTVAGRDDRKSESE